MSSKAHFAGAETLQCGWHVCAWEGVPPNVPEPIRASAPAAGGPHLPAFPGRQALLLLGRERHRPTAAGRSAPSASCCAPPNGLHVCDKRPSSVPAGNRSGAEPTAIPRTKTDTAVDWRALLSPYGFVPTSSLERTPVEAPETMLNLHVGTPCATAPWCSCGHSRAAPPETSESRYAVCFVKQRLGDTKQTAYQEFGLASHKRSRTAPSHL